MNSRVIWLVLAAVAVALAGQPTATGGLPLAPTEVVRAAEPVDPHSDFGNGACPEGAPLYTDAGNVTWTYGTPHTTGLSRLASVVTGDELSIVTGEVEGGGRVARQRIFNFTTNTWSEGPSHPGGGISNADAVAVSDTLIIVGPGWLATSAAYDQVSVLNLNAGTWTAGATVPITRLLYYTMADAGGNAYIFGGANATTTFNKTYRYNPATNTLTELADMPIALRSQVALAAGDTIYLIGGQTAPATPYNGTTNFLKYSISGDDWTAGPAMPFAMSWGAGAAYNDPAHGWVLYAFAGYNASAAIVNQSWAYTVATGTWEATNNLQTARRSHGGTIYRDTLLAVCGWGSAGFLNTIERGAIEPTAVESRFLWLYSDYAQPDTTLGVRLEALGDTLTYLDVRNYTPTLGELTPYDAVGAHSNYAYDDPVALGNVLADYVDAGGGVVLCASSFTTGWGMGGRVITGDYATIGLGGNNQTATTLGWHNSGHPIMSGVSAVGEWLRASATFVTPDSVARWADGTPYVGVSGNRKVVGVNQYPGIISRPERNGDWALVIRNALYYVAGMVGTEEFDPFRPALSVRLETAPNPVRRQATVNWAVPHAGEVSIGIYDAGGRLVRRLFSGRAEPGAGRASWNLADSRGDRVASGVYFCRLDAGGRSVSSKLVVD